MSHSLDAKLADVAFLGGLITLADSSDNKYIVLGSHRCFTTTNVYVGLSYKCLLHFVNAWTRDQALRLALPIIA